MSAFNSDIPEPLTPFTIVSDNQATALLEALKIMDTPMMEDCKESAELTEDPSPMEKVFAIPLLLDQILKGFSTPDLLTLRSVNKTWNCSVLRQLQRRDDLFITLSETTLLKYDPFCFQEEESKTLLRRINLRLDLEEERNVRDKLERFMDLHHAHIIDLEASVPDILAMWNKWSFPKLESLFLSGNVCDFSSIPKVVGEKASVTHLWLVHWGDHCLEMNDLLLAATPSLQELFVGDFSTPNVSLLTTTNLKVFHGVVRPAEAAAFFQRYGEGLEELNISFDSETPGEVVLEAQMPKLMELNVWFKGAPVYMKNFGPAVFPNLESLRLDLAVLDEETLCSQKRRFEKLTDLCIVRPGNRERRKMEKLLALCEKATHLKVSLGSPYSSASNILDSLACYGKLKQLGLYVSISFDLGVDEEGVSTCGNLEEVEEYMMKLRRLAERGLKRLYMCVAEPRRLQLGPQPLLQPSFYIGDWGESFCNEILNLAKMVKKGTYVHGSSFASKLFCPALEERMRQAIAEKKLPLTVKW